MRLPLLALATLIISALANDIIPNSWIVVLQNDITPSDFTNHLNWVRELHRQSRSALPGIQIVWNSPNFLKGYAGKFDDVTIATIRQSRLVMFVEHDQLMHTMEPGNPGGVKDPGPWEAPGIITAPRMRRGNRIGDRRGVL